MGRKVVITTDNNPGVPAVTGFKSVTTLAEVLKDDPRKLAKGMRLKAGPANSGLVFVSLNANIDAGATPANSGWPLAANEEVFIPCEKASDVWVVASASLQNVSFMYN